MSGSAWAGELVTKSERRDEGDGRDHGGQTHPRADHRRAVPLRVVRLPGELTDSGTTCPTPAPRPVRAGPGRLAGDSPQKSWFPGSATRCPGADGGQTQRGARADPVGPTSTDTRATTVVGRRRPRQTSAQEPGVPFLTGHSSHTSLTAVVTRPELGSGRLDLRARPPAAPAAAAAPARCRPGRRARGAPRRRSVSSGGGPSSTVTTQSWQARPRTTQVSQSIRVVMSQKAGSAHRQSGSRRAAADRRAAAALSVAPPTVRRHDHHRRAGSDARPSAGRGGSRSAASTSWAARCSDVTFCVVDLETTGRLGRRPAR